MGLRRIDDERPTMEMNYKADADLFRYLLKGRYLDAFEEYLECDPSYKQMTDEGLRLQQMQEFGPGDDCDCAGPNDRPGCPVCAQAAREVYTEEF